jgi:creatinine amidohydrolase
VVAYARPKEAIDASLRAAQGRTPAANRLLSLQSAQLDQTFTISAIFVRSRRRDGRLWWLTGRGDKIGTLRGRRHPFRRKTPMTSKALTEYRYEKLTWPEINDAIEAEQVCIVPCGAVEQHGHHLPLDVDLVCPTGIAHGAGREIPDKLLVLPIVAYGYTGHVMDFPGTINTDYEHFIHQVLDITKSLAYHGFKKIILLNGHGSNMPNLDLAARRTNLETDAECCVVAWWNLLTVDKTFLPRWRESKFPGGCSHACELETSLYLYLDEENVRKDLIKSGTIRFNDEDNEFNWVDLFGAGPATVVSWTSSYSGTGVLGDAEKGTPEKGRQVYEESVKQLVRYTNYFHSRPKDKRIDLHRRPLTIPLPWGQRPISS